MSATIDPRHELDLARKDYETLKAADLSLNLTRGKPAAEQLDISDEMLAAMTDYRTADGTDARNYGGLLGLPELRETFGAVLGVPASQLAVGGNSSLEIMNHALVQCLLHGAAGIDEPWHGSDITFLCPVPGYDRHFSLIEHFGIKAKTVPMTGAGPDMDIVEELVASDASIRGMWCVPQYSNPTGETYSSEVVRRLATMKTAAKDFRLFWDNAYAVHDLADHRDRVDNILTACVDADNAERPMIFASTSKITHAGHGIGFFGGSEVTAAWWSRHAAMRTIGPDKVNQLRHARMFGSPEALTAHMEQHAEIVTPKFDACIAALREGLAGRDIATWSTPRGGYFISLDVLPGCADRVVELAAGAGISLTPAGATYPGGEDPEDKNIRLAPTFPSLPEVERAMAGVATCVKVACYEKLSRESE